MCVWLVLLPAVWSQCEMFSFCFDNLCAINHGEEISHYESYKVYSFALRIVYSNTMSQSVLSLHICYTKFQ